MPTLGYPLDLTGAAPSNLVVNEIHTFTTAPTRLFVPAAGPFYTTTLDIRNNTTNAVLQPNTDYKLLHLHREGTIASGKQICAVIYVINLDITAIRIQYQCIGDNYADTSDIIRDLLTGSPPPEPSIAWGHVFGAPVQFAPAEHLHHVDEVYGMQEVVSAIEQLRVATLSGDSFAFDAIYQYLANLFANYDWVTQQELANAINTATVNPYGTVRSYRTFAELRAETNITNDAGTIYICAGRASLLDGQGRSFVWNKNSNAVDNDETVLQPTIIGVGQSGRMQAAMRLEFDVRNLAQRLGRRIGTTGIIETDLSTIASLGTTNLDALVTSGVYWVSSATGGRPSDVDSGVIFVERSHINNVIQTLHVHTSNIAPPDDDITRTNVVIQHRSGSRNVDTDAMTWTPWESMFSRTRAVVNGIDTELALTRSTNIDINTIARSSRHWVLATAPNTPFPTEACVLDVQCINSADTIQHATTVDYEAYRYGSGGVDYNGHTWTGWVYRANRNGDVNQVFNVNSLPLVDILPNHAVNAGFLATQMATLWSRLTVAGVDADLATTNSLDGVDLNGFIIPGEYYYRESTTNAPTPYGLLTVRRENPDIIYQMAHSAGYGESPQNTIFTRYGRFFDGIWHWPTTWNRTVTTTDLDTAIANIETDAPNLGIVIRYYGQTSILMPCYIGEDFFAAGSKVKISGVTKEVSILNIEPAKIADYGTGMYYVYLVETSPDVYKLTMYTLGANRPKFPVNGNMTQTRKHLYHPSDNPATSNRLFLGLAYVVDSQFQVCRNWFQDTGFIEYYHALAHTNATLNQPALITARNSGGTRQFVFDGTSSVAYTNDHAITNSVSGEYLQALPLLIWGGERVQVDFYAAIAVDRISGLLGYGIVTLDVYGIWFDGSGSFVNSSPIPRIHKTNYAIGNMSYNNIWETASVSTYVYEPQEALYYVHLLGRVNDSSTVLTMKGTEPSGIVHDTLLKVAYEQVHNFRSLNINALDPSYWYPNQRIVYITADTFDLNLRTYQESVYGSPAPANCLIEYIVQTGVIVSASSTAVYAVTNPTGFASGVVVKLTIQNGAVVAGRGGRGGRGGRAWAEYVDTNGDGYLNYIGGSFSSPSSHVHGLNGGNAIRSYRALIINNQGYISVGGGGGGGSGGAIAYNNTYGRVQSGSGGGGGWPFGEGGLAGQIIADDSTSAYYTVNNGYGSLIEHNPGNPGNNGTGLSNSNAPGGNGAQNYGGPTFHAIVQQGGRGSDPIVGLGATAGAADGLYYGSYGSTYGEYGNGGNNGTYAINNTAGLISFVGSQGNIVGTVTSTGGVNYT